MKLPLIGLGTWELREDVCTKVVELALDLGYKHIDTAHNYRNHPAIRKAIKGVDRQKIYITSKLAIGEQIDPKSIEDSVQKACELALKELGTDYLDLYLIHAPEPGFPLEKIFALIEKLTLQGKIRKAGVSNYTIHHLEDLRKAGHTPFANQVEFHPYLYQRQLLDYCRAHHIELISYRSFGKGKLLLEESLFEQIGSKHNKSGSQVILRWLIQKEIPSIPKASSEQHLRENIEVFDFSLTAEEMSQLDTLHRNKRFCRADNPEHLY